MKPPIRWPRGVKSVVCMTFDLDAETAWISRDPENINRLTARSVFVFEQSAVRPLAKAP